jgi:DNA phosphorothioation-associated putative methyltransferase
MGEAIEQGGCHLDVVEHPGSGRDVSSRTLSAHAVWVGWRGRGGVGMVELGSKAGVQVTGKRVGGALYLHVSALPRADPAFRGRVERAAAIAVGEPWNVVKAHGDVISLLLYEDFDEVAFPALLRAAATNLRDGSVKRTDYSRRANPPILHRKETLLSFDDPRCPAFAALTRMAEEHGLFVDAHKIGTRDAWLARVAEAGLEIRGTRMLPQEAASVAIARHRTAIVRRELSQPMQLLVANGVVAEGRTVFDYGCGQGDDVAALQAAGFEAFGWDPHHAKDGPRRTADIVNLGFVLNVIEDRHEREETLKAAWSFARRALSIAVMTMGKTDFAGLKPFLDGHVTTRGTFQKYFGQQELRDLIERVLGEAPVALATGVFVAFRDKEMEQEVLLRRRSRMIARPTGMRPPPRARIATAPRPELAERIRGELEELWSAMLERGRVLDAQEVSSDLMGRLQVARVSSARASQLCLSDLFDQGELTAAAARRREDLLVHFALTIFPGAAPYARLPRSIQRDVRAFFGSHAGALSAARDLLFSAGRADVVRDAVKMALAGGLGGMRREDSFRHHADAVGRLPAVLRVLVGCAGILRGGVDGADFVDINLDAPRVSFLTCANPTARLPILAERTRVDLGRLKASTERLDGVLLYLKGRYLPMDAPGREEQAAFDNTLLAEGIVTQDGRGPRLTDLKAWMLRRKTARAD